MSSIVYKRGMVGFGRHLIVVVALLICGYATAQMTAQEYVNRGNDWHNKGDYDKAIEDYNQALRINPQNANAYVGRGAAWGNKGDHDKAIADYNQALRINPQNADAYYNRGTAWNYKGDHDKAIADYNQALRINPQNATAYVGRGAAWGNRGDHDKAIADYNQALRINPQYALAYKHRGFAWNDKGDHDKAIADYNQALRINPQDANAYVGRGAAWGNKGDHDKAIADYNQALRINPQNADAYYNRGTAWNDKGDHDKAIADYNQALRINPQYALAYNNRGTAWNDKGDHDKAIADYNQALRINPQDALAYNNRGFAWANKGDHDKAIADYNQALRINPQLAQAKANLAEAQRLRTNQQAQQTPPQTAALTNQTRPTAEAEQKKRDEREGKLAAEVEAERKKRQDLEQKLAEVEAKERERQQAQAPQPQRPQVALRNERRLALVIGNSSYKVSPLDNPANDANDVAESLKKFGFQTTLVRNATLGQMREATRKFADQLPSADVALIYFAGHGIESNRKNYMIPVNADLKFEYELADQGYDAGIWLEMLESIKSNNADRVNIVILDACRNNSLIGSRNLGRGLGKMDAPSGTFLAYSTAPGKVAADGGRGERNSPFTKHLIRAMQQPNQPIEEVFKEVRRNVGKETNGAQVPWESTSLTGFFTFRQGR